MNEKHSVFISHSHVDNIWCRSFVSSLQSQNLDVWYDEKGISGGSAWVTNIERELQAREIFILILTPEAWASSWVQRELQLALVTMRTIIPIKLKDMRLQGFLMTIQWINAIDVEISEVVLNVMKALIPLSATSDSALQTIHAILAQLDTALADSQAPEKLADLQALETLAENVARTQRMDLAISFASRADQIGKAVSTYRQLLSALSGVRKQLENMIDS